MRGRAERAMELVVMRVLVATDSIGSLSSARAGQLLAGGWTSAQTSVVPIGEAGRGFVAAYADRLRVPVRTTAEGEILLTSARSTQPAGGQVAALQVEVSATEPTFGSSSAPLGAALATLLAERPHRLYADLTGGAALDGGAGLLAALGATGDRPLDCGATGLAGLSEVDWDAARERLGATELVGVVPAAELTQPLLGLRGIVSRSRPGAGPPTAEMLAVDAALEQFARLVSPASRLRAGAGACGGLGFAVLALGGRLTTGAAVALADTSLGGWDLLVTGCSAFDFASRGGGVVAAVADAAGQALAPCVVVAGEVVIGSREMRTLGVEAAYAVHESTSDDLGRRDVTAEELAATARRVARTWSW